MSLFGFLVVVLEIFSVNSEWVEIPQFASKKSYLGVTPFSPYIYDKSSTFTTPFDGLIPPVLGNKNSKKDDPPRQSITKLPDTLMKNMMGSSSTTTTPSPRTSRRWNPKNTTAPTKKQTQPNSKKPQVNSMTMQRKKDSVVNLTTSSTTTTTTTEKTFYQPKVNKVLVDEHEYDEEVVYDDDEEVYDERGLPDDDESAELRPEDGDGDDEYYYDDEEEEVVDNVVDEEKGAKEGFSYASFLPYLQNIQSTLIRNSHKSAHDKVSFLVEIKNRLLYAIQQKIASLWSPAAKSRKTRSTRGDHQPSSWEKGDSGMGFPSNEGALLTLGFLTFAVFLIKCILKLVQAMKGKGHHGYGGGQVVVVVANGTTAALGKRSISDEETAKMLNLLDTYKYK